MNTAPTSYPGESTGRTADAVVVGGGTVGAWAACFLREAGLADVVLVEADTLGQGASSRAAGMVRAQGGTETAIRLGLFSQAFYRGQRDRYPLDSGFVEQGYLMPSFTADEVDSAHTRIRTQRRLGLNVEWLTGDDVDDLDTGLARGSTLGASFAAGDGYLDAPRNVLAYTAALCVLGVRLRERTTFTGLLTRAGRVTGVQTSGGPIATDIVVLTGGPDLAEVGRAAGARVPAGGTRHQVVVTSALPGSAGRPMVFDLSSGIYWRPGDNGGLLWGMSNPDEAPGVARDIDWAFYDRMRDRLNRLYPATTGLTLQRAWAATIDYTPDHLPILGPVLAADGPVAGAVLAGAAGHGMMWGPAVARAAADLALTGRTDVVDVNDLGLDRFDADGRSRITPEPVSLPFPERTF